MGYILLGTFLRLMADDRHQKKNCVGVFLTDYTTTSKAKSLIVCTLKEGMFVSPKNQYLL